jgi:hypothetical protein
MQLKAAKDLLSVHWLCPGDAGRSVHQPGEQGGHHPRRASQEREAQLPPSLDVKHGRLAAGAKQGTRHLPTWGRQPRFRPMTRENAREMGTSFKLISAPSGPQWWGMCMNERRCDALSVADHGRAQRYQPQLPNPPNTAGRDGTKERRGDPGTESDECFVDLKIADGVSEEACRE